MPIDRTPERPHAPVVPLRPRLLDQVCMALRTRHYSRRTEKTYVAWIRQFILFHDKRHPDEMGEVEIVAFLSHLASERGGSPSTQNQARRPALLVPGRPAPRHEDGRRHRSCAQPAAHADRAEPG